MSHFSRLFALLVLVGGFFVITQAPVRAEACDTSQYLADCISADNAAYGACADACWRHYQAGVQSYSGGYCHWYGEDDPGNCEEDWGSLCSCFSYYTYGYCYCGIL